MTERPDNVTPFPQTSARAEAAARPVPDIITSGNESGQKALRRVPQIGDCGLRAEDTGIDLWLSRQYSQGQPSDLLKALSIQTWERVQFLEHGVICPVRRARFLADIGLSVETEVHRILPRYGWVYLSHHGARG